MVEYSLWYGSILDLTKEQILALYKYHVLLQDSVRFIPRLMTYSCLDCEQEIKDANCVSDGKYCLVKPQSASQEMLSGLDNFRLLEEGIRQMCIYEVLEDKRVKAGEK